MSQEVVFQIFFATWVVIGIVGFVIFYLGKDPKRKRKILPPFVVGTGALFIGFVYLMGFRGEVFYIAVPAVALISVINIRSTKFCDACGKTIINQNFLAKTEYCSKCGEKL